jgi:hypothetical protein
VTRSASSVWIRLAALAGVGIAILFGSACDSGGAKRDSLYQKLVGSWRIYEVSLDGGTVRPEEDTTRIEFLQREESRAYRIIRVASNDTTGRGQIEIERSNELYMTLGLGGLLVWNFEFNGSLNVRFQLQRAEDDESVRNFLTAIGLREGTQDLALDLRRDSE